MAEPAGQHHEVKAGEVGGFLDQVLVSVADNFEAEVKMRGKIKSAMTYPVVVFIVAINVKIRDGKVANRPVYVALAVTCEGRREILGVWAGEAPSVTCGQVGEGAKYWLHVLTEIKNRGVNDVLMVVCDGLTGLPEAIEATWPATSVQTSSIDTGRWRDGLAGHRATGRGPMQTCAFEAPMQTCPFRWRAGR